MEYASGPKRFEITPRREDAVVRMARRNYPAMAKSVAETFSEQTVPALAKKVNEELNQICSSKSNSILKQHCDGSNFSWENIWIEVERQLPTLHLFLISIIKNAASHKPLVCMITSMILKHRFQNISFVQGMISVLLYGNSTHKQVKFIFHFI